MPSKVAGSAEIAETAERLVGVLGQLGSVAVAFSGGVDSGVVAKAAVLALGERAVAVTAVSASLSRSDRATAQDVAQLLGIRHIELNTSEFARSEYRRNAGDRCFFCKQTLYSALTERLADWGVRHIANGANTDDLGDYRPGMEAAGSYRVRSPLIELGIDKSMVRELARYWQISIAEKPAAPCLSSRVAYGVEVTEERVQRIEQAEAVLRELTGVKEFRVRCEAGELARIEVPVEMLSRLIEDEVRRELVARLVTLGFRNVTLDLQGFRSGSLNAALVALDLPAG